MTPAQVFYISGAHRSRAAAPRTDRVGVHGIPGAQLGSTADLLAFAGTPLG